MTYSSTRSFRFLVLLAVLAPFAATAACGDDSVPTSPTGPTTFEGAEHTQHLQPPDSKAIDGQYIVTLRDRAVPAHAARDAARRHGVSKGHVYTQAMRGFSFRGSEQAARQIRKNPNVLSVDADRTVSMTAQSLPTGVDRIEADQSSVAAIDGRDGRVGVGVGVIDTGVDLDHPDLNVVQGVDCASYSSCKAGGSYGDDDNGHGTHVAGTIGALDDSTDVVGVAPGAELYAIKVLGSDGSGSMSDVVAGLDWAVQNADKIDVVNMSVGAVGCYGPLETSVQSSVDAGIVSTVAAGNSGEDIAGSDGTLGTCDDTIPAAYPEVATISAMADYDGQPGGLASTYSTGEDDSFAEFSNYATTVADGNPVSSPGAAIDLLLPGAYIESTCQGGGTCLMSGTSMAAPHGAGLAALYVAQNGAASDASGVYAIRQALIDEGWNQDSADGLDVLDDPDSHWERIGQAVFSSSDDTDDTTMAVDISPSSQSATGTAGDSVSYDFDVCNTGDAADSYDLSTNSGWSSSVTPTSISDLAAGGCTTVTVTHSIPSDASDGASDSGTLSAASPSSSASASATFETTADVNQVSYAVDVSPSSQTGSGAPDESVSYDYSVCNNGDGTDSYALSVTSGWTSSVTPTSISDLAAGGCTTVTVTHTVPSGASDGDTDSGTLTVDSSNSSASAQATFETTAQVDTTPPLAVDGITPSSLSTGRTTTVTVSGSGFQSGATLEFENGKGPAPRVSNVVVQDSTSLTADVRVKNGGPPKQRVFDVRVTNPDGSTDVLVDGFAVNP